ncbi:hypothetical protein, partial [Marinobacter halodurans]
MSEAELSAYCREKGLYPEQARVGGPALIRTGIAQAFERVGFVIALIGIDRCRIRPEQVGGFRQARPDAVPQ